VHVRSLTPKALGFLDRFKISAPFLLSPFDDIFPCYARAKFHLVLSSSALFSRPALRYQNRHQRRFFTQDTVCKIGWIYNFYIMFRWETPVIKFLSIGFYMMTRDILGRLCDCFFLTFVMLPLIYSRSGFSMEHGSEVA